MSATEKDALIFKLFDRLDGHEQRWAQVEAKVAKTRQNSSQPPSSDGLQSAKNRPPATE
jgi:hypothetical protein